MKLRLRLLKETAPTNAMGNSSTIHGTGNIDTVDRPSVARAKERAKKSFRDKLAGRRVNETKHFLTWNGRKFEIKPSRNGKNRAILPQTPDRYIATAKKPVKLGRSTPLIVNPSMKDTQNKTDNDNDVRNGKARNSSIVKESVTRKTFRDVAKTVRAIEDPAKRQEFADHHAQIFARLNPRFDHGKWHAAAGTKTKAERGIKEGYSLVGRALAAAVGAYVGNKIRKKMFGKSRQQSQQQSLPRPTPSSRYNPTSGPWGNRVQDPSRVTGPKIKSANNSSSSPPLRSNRMSSADFRSMISKNPTLKVSGGRK